MTAGGRKAQFDVFELFANFRFGFLKNKVCVKKQLYYYQSTSFSLLFLLEEAVEVPRGAEGRLHIIHRVEGREVHLQAVCKTKVAIFMHLVLVLIFSIEQHLLKPLAPLDFTW